MYPRRDPPGPRCRSSVVTVALYSESLCPYCSAFEGNFSAVWELPGFASQLNYTQVCARFFPVGGIGLE